MNLLGEPLRVGHLVHTAERRAAADVVRFYADTFEDRNPAYSGSSAVAPPLLFHSEVYAHPERWYLKRLVGNLHARQEWLLFAPIPLGAALFTRSTLIERYRKRNRDYLVNEVDYNDEHGRLLVRGRTHQSFLADEPEPQAGFVVDRSSADQKKAARAVGQGPGAELEPVALEIGLDTCWRFSGPGANYHTDREAARKFGFPDVVVQGMLGTCLVSQLMGNAFGRGWFEGGRMDVKLTNVLWAGESVRARAKLLEDVPEGQFTRRSAEVWLEKEDAKRTVVLVGSASALLD